MKQKNTLLAGFLLASASLAQAGQYCSPDILPTAPDSRYSVHGDGTVSDEETGLMWKQCSEGQTGARCASGEVHSYTLKDALMLAEEADFANYRDWRLPNLKELTSLVELSCQRRAINAQIFPNTPVLTPFCSSSPYARDLRDNWAVNFDRGRTLIASSCRGHVRLVRG